MLRNYFKIAIRNLAKRKGQAAINIIGLAIGMGVALLIGLWVGDELSFDRYNKNYDSISQIARKSIVNGDPYIATNNNHFPLPLASVLRQNYANLFKHVALTTETQDHIIAYDNKKFSQSGIYVEPGFFGIFTLKMLAGSNTSFADPNNILLSTSLAGALFGDKDPVGKIIKFDNNQSLKVAGVYEDAPYNSSFSNVSFYCPWNLLVSTNDWVRNNQNDWVNSSFLIYVQRRIISLTRDFRKR
jgi:putative ABC transport system permease protein